MALNRAELRSASHLGAGSGLWAYQAPSTDDVTAASYFNGVAQTLVVGDRIFVTQFTNFNLSAQAYASSTELVVTAVSDAGVVTVEEV